MRGMNRVILLGILGEPVRPRRTRSGVMVLDVRLATRRPGRAGDEVTDWHQVRLWGPLAEQCVSEAAVGDPLGVEGQLRGESWIDREGITHQRVYIHGERVHLVPAREAPTE